MAQRGKATCLGSHSMELSHGIFSLAQGCKDRHWAHFTMAFFKSERESDTISSKIFVLEMDKPRDGEFRD